MEEPIREAIADLATAIAIIDGRDRLATGESLMEIVAAQRDPGQMVLVLPVDNELPRILRHIADGWETSPGIQRRLGEIAEEQGE